MWASDSRSWPRVYIQKHRAIPRYLCKHEVGPGNLSKQRSWPQVCIQNTELATDIYPEHGAVLGYLSKTWRRWLRVSIQNMEGLATVIYPKHGFGSRSLSKTLNWTLVSIQNTELFSGIHHKSELAVDIYPTHGIGTVIYPTHAVGTGMYLTHAVGTGMYPSHGLAPVSTQHTELTTSTQSPMHTTDTV